MELEVSVFGQAEQDLNPDQSYDHTRQRLLGRRVDLV